MGDFRAELAALVAAYDEHRKWTLNAVFEGLHQAVERARAVLAQPGPEEPTDDEIRNVWETGHLPTNEELAADGGENDLLFLFTSAYYTWLDENPEEMELHEAKCLRAVFNFGARWASHPESSDSSPQPLRPIPVIERLPGPEDCQPWPGEPDETHWCWVFVKGSLGDDAWERRPVTCLTAYRSIHTHWLPAHALPLPEVE